MSLWLWDTPYPHWSWWRGTQKGVAFLDLASTIEKWRGRWCPRICHYPRGFSLSIMTKGSSWGCFTPLASSSEKNMSLFVHLCFEGGILWILFTCLWYDFLRDLIDPSVDGLPMIVFISSIMLGGYWDVRSSSLGEALRLSLLSSLNLLGSPFFTNLYSFPFHMSSFIFAPSCLCNLLCNGRNPCGNGNTSSYYARWVTNVMA